MVENFSRTFKVTLLVLFVVVLGMVAVVILKQKGIVGGTTTQEKMSPQESTTSMTKENPAPAPSSGAPGDAPAPSTNIQLPPLISPSTLDPGKVVLPVAPSNIPTNPVMIAPIDPAAPNMEISTPTPSAPTNQ